MSQEELLQRLIELAEEARDNHPAVSSTLYTVAGALVMGTMGDLLDVCTAQAARMIGTIEAARAQRN